jgi:lysophospholipid acyltransferase (LPLAT)-like uncharacterized protein
MVKGSAAIKLKGLMFAWTLRLQRLTWRVCMEGEQQLDRLYNAGNRFLVCFWHGKYVPIFPLLEGYRACIVSSLSVRGSVIAEICANFGYQSAQIPDHHTHDPLKLMGDVLSDAQAVATAVDGPLGPYHRVKYGIIRMASALGYELLPVSVGSRRKIVLRKRWDRMELPLPFTRVCLVFGRPIQVPSELRHRQLRQITGHLSEAMAALDDEAQHLALRSNG